jgi:HTH-type transcriptional regulator/antitoxin HigA
MSYKQSESGSSLRIKSTTAIPGKRTARYRIDKTKYGRLLAEVLPRMPRNATEHRRLLETVERLLDKGETRTAEETALAEILVALVSRYEQALYNPMRSKPNELLGCLMEEHALRQRDLLDVFPTRSRVSEVLSGKRAITKEQAVRLGHRFGVDASAFIEMSG